MKRKTTIITSVILGFAGLIAFDVAASYALFTNSLKTDTNSNNGAIGIYSYFDEESGDGLSAAAPFIITRPRHFYNLMRLQELGAFNATASDKYFFRFGKDINPASGGEHDDDLVVYTSDAVDTYGYVLDMSNYTIDSTTLEFRSIGTHAVPFLGEVDGSNVIVQNLEVSADPDDAGIFGYIGDNGKVKNIIFEDVTIKSRGYDKNKASDIFTTDFSSLSAEFEEINLDTTAITTQDDATAKFTYTDVDLDNIANTFGHINITYPTDSSDPDVSYFLSIGNSLLVASNETSTGARIDINPVLARNSEFIAANQNVMLSRAYVVAKKTGTDGIPYSRVVGSYQVYLLINLSEVSGVTHYQYTIDVIEDAFDNGTTSTYSQYHHCNNIGIIAGHADGSITDSYVFGDVVIDVNDNALMTSDYGSQNYESDFGLVGETGDHVSNSLNPEAAVAGEVGYVSADDVYAKITGGSTTYSYHRTGGTVDASGNLTGNSSAFYDYSPVYDTLDTRNSLYQNIIKDQALPVVSTDPNYVGAADHYHALATGNGTIAFKSYKVIEGNADNGLGVFDIVTNYGGGTQTDITGDYRDDVIYNGNSLGEKGYSSVSFSTDESSQIRALSSINTSKLLYVASEIEDYTQTTEVNFSEVLRYIGNELRGSLTTPWQRSYAGPYTKSPSAYTKRMMENRVYLYEMNLKSESDPVTRYFSNTPYTYLKKHLEDTLVDSIGRSVKQGDANFGISLRRLNSSGQEVNLSAITKYLTTMGRSRVEFVNDQNNGKVSWNENLGAVVSGNNGLGTSIYDTDSREYYAFGEMGFKLNRTSNITIVYPYIGNVSGSAFINADSSPYITIHRRDVAIQNQYNGTRYPIVCAPYPNTSEINSLYYYPEDTNDAANQTPTKWSTGSMGNPIFVHTFQLPAGEYFVANNCISVNLPFSYIAVEGQDEGRLSGFNIISFTSDTLENVDFLISSPLEGGYVIIASDSDKRSRIAVAIKFSDASQGTITITNSATGLTFTTDGSVISVVTTNEGINIEGFTAKTVSINGSTPSTEIQIIWPSE